jgi:hypothetical protein
MGENFKLTVEIYSYEDHKNYIKKKVSAPKRLNYLILSTFIMLLPVVSWAACTGSSPTWNSTADYSSVNTCAGNASAGDTINISGNATWNSTLTISKSIKLIGAGTESTKITNGGIHPIIDINLSSDAPLRISGIYFDNVINTGATKSTIVVLGHGLTQMRIDNNTFNKGKRTVQINGWVYGVIDSNSFINCDIAVGVTGDDDAAWNRTIAAGTANALFIESNTFTSNNNTDIGELNEQIYHQEGARTVIRYNTFDGSAQTANDFCPYDSHGNQSYYTGDSRYDFRGQPIIEIYENTWKAHHSYRFMNIRGGSNIIYNNTFTTISGSPTVFYVQDEESWQTAFFSPLKTVWPAEDQINNSFFWGNTLNGAPITDISVSGANGSTFIQKDRDYFMHAPQSTGGIESYTGRLGGALTFSSSGANAYYPYTPYTYPHPLRGDIAAPKGVRIVN